MTTYDPAPYREAFADPDGDMPEHCTTIDGLMVAVDKDGGGTLGRTYDGTWTVSVARGPVFLLRHASIRTGTPRAHAEVARLAYDYAAQGEEI